MALSQINEPTDATRLELVEVLMNVPFPLTVLHGPNHQVILANRARLSQSIERTPIGREFAQTYPELADRVVPILDRVFRSGSPEHEREVKIGERFFN